MQAEALILAGGPALFSRGNCMRLLLVIGSILLPRLGQTDLDSFTQLRHLYEELFFQFIALSPEAGHLRLQHVYLCCWCEARGIPVMSFLLCKVYACNQWRILTFSWPFSASTSFSFAAKSSTWPSSCRRTLCSSSTCETRQASDGDLAPVDR